MFSNKVALFFSEAEEEKVKKELKAIEKCAGRRPEDKKEEKVCLDIDLLFFDDRVSVSYTHLMILKVIIAVAGAIAGVIGVQAATM